MKKQHVFFENGRCLKHRASYASSNTAGHDSRFLSARCLRGAYAELTRRSGDHAEPAISDVNVIVVGALRNALFGRAEQTGREGAA